LEQELEHEWDEFERVEEDKNALISELTHKLKHLKKVTMLTLKYEQQTATAKLETLARLRKNRLDELKAAINKSKSELKTDKRVNKRTVTFLTKQKDQMDSLADEWEKKYQRDFTEITGDLTDLTSKRESDQVVLIDKQERWEGDKSNKIALMAEMKKRELEEQERVRLLDIMNLAQRKIRFAWRVYWRRRKKQLIRLRRRRLARARAKRKALAAKFPLMMMQKRK